MAVTGGAGTEATASLCRWYEAMLDCSEFLDSYSEYRDGLLGEGRREAFLAHMAECPSCARYDRVIARGTELFRQLPKLQPSEDFLPRLQHRIFHVEDELRGLGRHASGASTALTFSIAALFALAAWLPALRTAPPVLELAPVAARAPQPSAEASTLFRSGPLLIQEQRAPREWNDLMAPASNDLFFRYSPMGATMVQTVMNP